MKRNLGTLLLLFVAVQAYPQFYTNEFQKDLSSVQVIGQNQPSSKFQDTKSKPLPVKVIQPSIESTVLLASLPLDEMILTSRYGFRTDPFSGTQKLHRGIDLKTNRSKVYSMLHGKIQTVGNDPLLGNFIKIQHGKYETIYGHLSQIWVAESEDVLPGTVLGISGNTGKSTGDHLHLTVKKGEEYINPVLFIQLISKLLTKEHVITYVSNP